MLCEEKRLELDGLSWTMMDATTTFSERKVKGEEMQEVYLHAEVFQEARDQDDVWEVKRLVKSSWVWGKKAYGQVPVVGYGRGRVFWRNMVIFNCKSERLSPRGIYILRCGRGHTMASVCFFVCFFCRFHGVFFNRVCWSSTASRFPAFLRRSSSTSEHVPLSTPCPVPATLRKC